MGLLTSLLDNNGGGGGGTSYEIITVAADFPTLAEAQAVAGSKLYVAAENITDNDPAKTNTGQSFIEGDVFVWDDSDSKYIKTQATGTVWGAITGTLSSQTDLQNALDAKEPIITNLPYTKGGIGINNLTDEANKFLRVKNDETGYELVNELGSQPSKVLFVDKNRSDTYTADGTLDRPFKTIQAAINQASSNPDAATARYCFSINSGTYEENLTLNEKGLFSVYFKGVGQVTFNPTTGNSLTANEDTESFESLREIRLENIEILKPVDIVGGNVQSTNPSSIILFKNCEIDANVNIQRFFNVYIKDVIYHNYSGSTLTFNTIHRGFIIGGSHQESFSYISGTILFLELPRIILSNFDSTTGSSIYVSSCNIITTGNITIQSGVFIFMTNSFLTIEDRSFTNNGIIHFHNSGTDAVFTTNYDWQNPVRVVEAFNLAQTINFVNSKTLPNDADVLVLVDSENSNLLKKLSWGDISIVIKAYFDTLYEPILGFTPENVANRENATIDTNTTKYPTVNLLKIGLDGKQTTALSSGNILVGNNSNVATAVIMSGDATIDNAGALTIADNSITFAKLANPTFAIRAPAMQLEDWEDLDGNAPATRNGARITFGNSADSYGWFAIDMPVGYDGEGFTAKFKFDTSLTTGTVNFAIRAKAIGNDEDISAINWIIAESVTTTVSSTANNSITSLATAPVSIANTPVAGNTIFFQVYRDVSEDTATGNIELESVIIEFV